MDHARARMVRLWVLAVLAGVLGALWVLGDVILPFVLGATVAYLLDPVADRLQRLGVSRLVATVMISLAALLIVIIALLLVVPMLVQQAIALVAAAPGLFEALARVLTDAFPVLPDIEQALRDGLAKAGELIQARGGEVLNRVLASALSLLDLVLLVVVVPVVAFYLLLDWDEIVARVDDLLPRGHAPTIRRLAAEIDSTIASFIRGMGAVCLIMGVYYAVALTLTGLQFGLVIGALAGLVTFIPYVGAIVGGALAIGLGMVQFWGDWVPLGLVVAVFAFGQAIEGNVLTPRLVGKSVGLHPVWLIFALAAFGGLFGFVGMLIAVPVAAAVGVLVRHAVSIYRETSLYRGEGG